MTKLIMIMRKRWLIFMVVLFAISVNIPDQIGGLNITGLFTTITFNVIDFFKAVLKQILLAIAEML